MNPYSLTRQGTDEVVANACGACHRIYPQKALAEHCCEDKLPCTCGQPKEPGYMVCRTCRRRHEMERLIRKFDKAKKIRLCDYRGMIVNPLNDHYTTVEEEDEEELERAEVPWMWGTTSRSLTLDAVEIVGEELERAEWFDGALHYFDTDALQELLDGWLKKHEHVKCYWPDESLAVIPSGTREGEE